LTDRVLLTCDLFRDTITAETRLAAPPSGAIRNVLDKRANLDTARRLGIPCPAQFDLGRLEQIPEMIQEIGFPIVLKNPGPSMDGTRPRAGLDWIVVQDEAGLHRHLPAYSSPGVFPLFQQLVTGVSPNLCCFAIDGEIVAIQQWRDLRTFRGDSAFRTTTAVSPDLYRYAELMLRELRWEGLAHLEFFVRENDADVRYIETNGRPWASIEGSIAAGWDFPLWMYKFLAYGEVPQAPPSTYAIGVKSRWHYGDLRALGISLRHGRAASSRRRSRTAAIIDYLSGFSPTIHSDVFRVADPLPELAEHARGVRMALRGLARALKRALGAGSGRFR